MTEQLKRLFVTDPRSDELFERVRERREREDKKLPASPLPVEFCLICGDSFDDEGFCETCGIAP